MACFSHNSLLAFYKWGIILNIFWLFVNQLRRAYWISLNWEKERGKDGERKGEAESWHAFLIHNSWNNAGPASGKTKTLNTHTRARRSSKLIMSSQNELFLDDFECSSHNNPSLFPIGLLYTKKWEETCVRAGYRKVSPVKSVDEIREMMLVWSDQPLGETNRTHTHGQTQSGRHTNGYEHTLTKYSRKTEPQSRWRVIG